MHIPVWADIQALPTILLKPEEQSVGVTKAREGAERDYRPGSWSQREWRGSARSCPSVGSWLLRWERGFIWLFWSLLLKYMQEVGRPPINHPNWGRVTREKMQNHQPSQAPELVWDNLQIGPSRHKVAKVVLNTYFISQKHSRNL